MIMYAMCMLIMAKAPEYHSGPKANCKTYNFSKNWLSIHHWAPRSLLLKRFNVSNLHSLQVVNCVMFVYFWVMLHEVFVVLGIFQVVVHDLHNETTRAQK